MYRPAAQDDHPAITGVTRNIGTGGAFIVTDSPLPVGTALHLEIRVATAERPIELLAEVRWVMLLDDDPDAAGMGVQFVGVTVEALLALNDYFASLTGTEVS